MRAPKMRAALLHIICAISSKLGLRLASFHLIMNHYLYTRTKNPGAKSESITRLGQHQTALVFLCFVLSCVCESSASAGVQACLGGISSAVAPLLPLTPSALVSALRAALQKQPLSNAQSQVNEKCPEIPGDPFAPRGAQARLPANTPWSLH
jgi:hypothetical protein